MGRIKGRGMGRGCAVPFLPLPCMDSGGLQRPARERPEARYPDVLGEAQRGQQEGGGEACRCNEMEWAGASGERIEGGGQTGLLLLGMKESQELKTIQANLSRQRVEHQCLSSEELKQRFPNIRLPRGEVGLLDNSGGVLYAYKALRALQDAVRQLGGIVRDGEKVVEINPGLLVTVKTPSRSYQAKSLVITAGPWTNQLLRPLGIELPLQTLRVNVCYWREMVPGSYGVSQAFPCFLWLGLCPHHIYGLPAGEYPGLMKVSYHHGNHADPEEPDCPTAHTDIRDVQILSGFVRDHLPDLKPEPAVIESCMYTNTPDEQFILDRHPKYDNIVIGAGFSGHGFKLAPVVGKILYELSMKLTPSYDLAPFRISRFPSLGKAHL
ncbi:peroxisomal sarcosine oxidase isoform X4 [Symphalangus syndactylus]|uniref:peroxisomal sarcosine oxidase isoform X4 n=1 Tax=Symphalangus syndactylus TaxID=9590 RepID=UPI00300475B8